MNLFTSTRQGMYSTWWWVVKPRYHQAKHAVFRDTMSEKHTFISGVHFKALVVVLCFIWNDLSNICISHVYSGGQNTIMQCNTTLSLRRASKITMKLNQYCSSTVSTKNSFCLFTKIWIIVELPQWITTVCTSKLITLYILVLVETCECLTNPWHL